MLTFTNTEFNKPQIIARLEAHAAADDFIKGAYWQNGKGCAVGCTIHSSDLVEYEAKFGIPRALAHLEDGIFEGLPNGEAKVWPLHFMRGIPIGTDLSLISWQFLHWLLTDVSINPGITHPVVKDAVMRCAKIVGELATGNEHTARSAAWNENSAAWNAWSARRTAWSVWGAESAAFSAASAGSAAWSAESAENTWSAESAESAARSAALSAAWSAESGAARIVAWSAAWTKMADKLIALIESAPVPSSTYAAS